MALTDGKYTIGIVAEMLNITPQTIRGYEERGFITPRRSQGNTRLYSDDDVDTLKMILKLTQDLKVNLAGIEVIIKLVQRIQAVEKEKDQLYQMLYEAGKILRNYMDQMEGDKFPMRTSMSTLIQIIDFGKM